MKLFTCASLVLGATSVLSADIMWDQIGEYDGSGLGGWIIPSQDFEVDDEYDTICADNFIGDGTSIDMLEVVIYGYNGFLDPSAITGYSANLYSSPEAAGMSLIGDIDSNNVDPANVTIDANWTSVGFLLVLDPGVTSIIGEQLIGLLPTNNFETNDQIFVWSSVASDGTAAIMGNPGEGFGFGPWQSVDDDAGAPVDAAYRIGGYVAGTPCDDALPTLCPADVVFNGSVDVADVLAIISSWGICGDGTFRPIGDIAPLPFGDCCVDVADVLAVISAWGIDCTVYGACCYENESCADTGEVACTDAGGTWKGDGSDCADVSCSGECAAIGCQLPDLEGHGAGGFIGATSDLNEGVGYVVADTFNPTTSGVVAQACWWGMYIDFVAGADCGFDGPGTGDSFTINYYLDDGDSTTPGTLLAGPFEVSASVLPTGDVIPSGLGDITQYKYTADHPAVQVESGECYWISIVNHTTGSCFWLWETAPQGDGRSAQDNGGWGTSDFDVAFCVDIETNLDACGVFTGPCCLAGKVCEVMSSLDCITAEGEYKGDNVTCADVNDCQPIPGACCILDSCAPNTTTEECLAFGGKFMGEDTTCLDVDCTPNPYDQIGASDGSSLDGKISGSQIFEAANTAYDIATIDDFTFDAQTTVTSIETVISGWNGYVGLDGVTNFTISVYSSPEAARVDLVGDVYSIDIVEATLPEWTGDGDLVSFEINLVLPAGTYYFAVIPWNSYGENGQAGIAGSFLGDGTFYQANPGGGFQTDPDEVPGSGDEFSWYLQELTGNAGYRLGIQ